MISKGASSSIDPFSPFLIKVAVIASILLGLGQPLLPHALFVLAAGLGLCLVALLMYVHVDTPWEMQCGVLLLGLCQVQATVGSDMGLQFLGFYFGYWSISGFANKYTFLGQIIICVSELLLYACGFGTLNLWYLFYLLTIPLLHSKLTTGKQELGMIKFKPPGLAWLAFTITYQVAFSQPQHASNLHIFIVLFLAVFTINQHSSLRSLKNSPIRIILCTFALMLPLVVSWPSDQLVSQGLHSLSAALTCCLFILWIEALCLFKHPSDSQLPAFLTGRQGRPWKIDQVYLGCLYQQCFVLAALNLIASMGSIETSALIIGFNCLLLLTAASFYSNWKDSPMAALMVLGLLGGLLRVPPGKTTLSSQIRGCGQTSTLMYTLTVANSLLLGACLLGHRLQQGRKIINILTLLSLLIKITVFLLEVGCMGVGDIKVLCIQFVAACLLCQL